MKSRLALEARRTATCAVLAAALAPGGQASRPNSRRKPGRAEGAYRDSFWLKLPDAVIRSVLSPGSCALDGDFLWAVERSEDGTFAIKKFRVEKLPPGRRQHDEEDNMRPNRERPS